MKAVLLLLLVPFAAHADPLPAGKAQIEVTVSGAALNVHTYRPAAYREGPLLVVMHGLGRNADGYRDYAVPLADQLGALVIAPHFPKKEFPTSAYQQGGLLPEGRAQPKEKWTFTAVSELITHVRKREGRPDMPCYLIGHSAGGQFLHRMAAFLPGDAVRIIAANPGSLTFPTRNEAYPYGFGGLPAGWSGDEQLKAYLAAPLTLYLGTADVLAKDLDMREPAMRQGKTRLERGHACFKMAQALATEREWPFHWQLIEAPGVGHSAKSMFSHPQAFKLFPSQP